MKFRGVHAEVTTTDGWWVAKNTYVLYEVVKGIAGANEAMDVAEWSERCSIIDRYNGDRFQVEFVED